MKNIQAMTTITPTYTVAIAAKVKMLLAILKSQHNKNKFVLIKISMVGTKISLITVKKPLTKNCVSKKIPIDLNYVHGTMVYSTY